MTVSDVRQTVSERVVCLAAADDWLNENETEETDYKTRKWLSECLTSAPMGHIEVIA